MQWDNALCPCGQMMRTSPTQWNHLCHPNAPSPNTNRPYVNIYRGISWALACCWNTNTLIRLWASALCRFLSERSDSGQNAHCKTCPVLLSWKVCSCCLNLFFFLFELNWLNWKKIGNFWVGKITNLLETKSEIWISIRNFQERKLSEFEKSGETTEKFWD